MASTPRARGSRHRSLRLSKPQLLTSLLVLMLTFVLTPTTTATPNDAYALRPTPVVTVHRLIQRQIGVPTVGTTTTTSAAGVPVATTTTTVDAVIPNTTTVASTMTTVTTSTTLTLTTSLAATTTTNSTASPTSSPSESGSNNQGLIIGGAAVGGLVFVIGIAIITFRCTLNRRDRQRRNKEMAATLAESFDRTGDPISTPRKGYMELGDGPPTPGSTSARGANLSRHGSQDAYFSSHKEGSGQDYYNPHYVQERYGTANAGNYGMYEETELSVIGGSAGRSMSPYPGGNPVYPPASVPANHFPGYNDHDYGHQDGGYYGGNGHAPRGY